MFYGIKVRTEPEICFLQIGHFWTAEAHCTQQHRCPQGWKTTPTSAFRQILQVFCSFNWRFSSTKSIKNLNVDLNYILSLSEIPTFNVEVFFSFKECKKKTIDKNIWYYFCSTINLK